MSRRMDRAANRRDRREANPPNHEAFLQRVEDQPIRSAKKRELLIIKPLTEGQRQYDMSINANTITFGTGPAGCGKTWWAVMRAARAYNDGKIKKIILTRPLVTCGEEKIGFLPGTLQEKIGPYLRPVLEALQEAFRPGHLSYLIETGVIEGRPLALMQGSSIAEAFVIIDEAQDVTPRQMKMALTRIGRDTTMVINGDLKQQNIQGKSGLQDGIDKIGHLESVGLVRFKASEIVRSGIVRDIVMAYEGEEDEYEDARPAEEPTDEQMRFEIEFEEAHIAA